MILFALTAVAADLQFSPDRPGVGESTATVGTGHAMVEAGLALRTEPTSFGTSALTGRIGLADGFELRVRAPDIGWQDDVTVGTIGLGAKFAGSTGDYFSVSMVPEVYLDPTAGTLGGSVNGNVTFSLDSFSTWAHSSVGSSPDGLSLFMGGGASVAIQRSGLYANGGYTVNGNSLVGGGLWLGLADALQMDAGLDVDGLETDAPNAIVSLGASVGF